MTKIRSSVSTDLTRYLSQGKPFIQTTDMSGNIIKDSMRSVSFDSFVGCSPLKGATFSFDSESARRKERFYESDYKAYKIVDHSDYFIDFVKEEFGEITSNLNFKSCLYVYEMYNDVVDIQTSNNFKRRFKLEKRKLQGFSN